MTDRIEVEQFARRRESESGGLHGIEEAGVAEEFEFALPAVELAIEQAAVAAIERGIEVTGVAGQFHDAAGGGFQPAVKESWIVDEWRVGNAENPIGGGEPSRGLMVAGASAERAEGVPLDPCAGNSQQRSPRFDHPADVRLWVDVCEHRAEGVADGAEDVNVVVGIHVRRRIPDEFDEPPELGAELGFDLAAGHATAQEQFQERPERSKLALVVDEGRHAVGR